MQYAQFVDAIEWASNGLSSVVGRASSSAAVRSCPGWTLEDLVAHVTEVHRWAFGHLIGTAQGDDNHGDNRDDGGQAFHTSALELVAELRARDPESSCWTLYAPAIASTWAIRLAVETTLHYWDAVDSVGGTMVIPDALAVAGVREVLNDMHPRQIRLGRTPPLPLHVTVQLKDSHGRPEQPLTLGDTSTRSAGELRATASDTLLLLWKRRTLDQIPFDYTGKTAALQAVLAAPLTP